MESKDALSSERSDSSERRRHVPGEGFTGQCNSPSSLRECFLGKYGAALLECPASQVAVAIASHSTRG